MRRILLITLIAAYAFPIAAQTPKEESYEEYKRRVTDEYNTYRTQKKTEFEQYRARLNEEFVTKLKGEWKTYKTGHDTPEPTKPKPPKPTVADNSKLSSPKKLPVKTVVPPEKPIPDIPVTLPKIDRTRPQKSYPVNFSFYNTPCGIGTFDRSLINFSSTDNSSISKAWKRLTENDNLEPLLADCLRLREEMQLCDWGFLQLADKVSETLYPDSPDKRTFLATAIMIQSGYDCRLMNKEGKLVLGFHPSHKIYEYSGSIVDGKAYYHYGPLSRNDALASTYTGDFKKSPTPIRMAVERYPNFAGNKNSIRKYTSGSWKEAPPFEIEVNKPAMDFFDSFPIMDWNLYGMAPVSPNVGEKLFPVMQILTEGLGEEEAVNLILGYMNYGFKYMTDDDQFGREKPFFPDENFFYPYNDCEDRAILFSRIVKNVLGLDAVYLFYPGHLAAAVRFSPGVTVKGSTIDVDGVSYVVCDPTCIGGKAGYLAPQFHNTPARVYKVKL